MESVEGLTCPHCRSILQEPIDGQYACVDCETVSHIPYSQDGTVYYNRPASRLKAMTFPAISLLGVVVIALGWAPLIPTLVVSVFAYIFLDSLVWASGGGASKLVAIVARMFLVALVAAGVYLQFGAA